MLIRLTTTAVLACLGVFIMSTSGMSGTDVLRDKPSDTFPQKTRMALKLAGLITFVSTSCPHLKPDYARFKSAVSALGVPVGDLDRIEMRGTALTYALRYKEDSARNCARALKDFGPGGTVISDLVQSDGK